MLRRYAKVDWPVSFSFCILRQGKWVSLDSVCRKYHGFYRKYHGQI